MTDNTIITRLARADDIPDLCRIEAECFSEPWSESSFTEFFGQSYSTAYVALHGDTVVGYAGMYITFGEGNITNVAVSYRWRRLGAGRRLIDSLARHDGVDRLLLEVRESNLPAITLYKSCGFVIDGTRRGFYSNPREDAFLMSLDAGLYRARHMSGSDEA
ncbi:MAG TPA: ribosomal protein S18-alanine N-acetyltransferase [Firmicutes bacterium]|nr:ribosomal protein S18-alanine N-acetyltransferase [Bacillota bacterium]